MNFSDVSDVEDGEIFFSDSEDERAPLTAAANLPSITERAAAELDKKIKEAEASYRELYIKYRKRLLFKESLIMEKYKTPESVKSIAGGSAHSGNCTAADHVEVGMPPGNCDEQMVADHTISTVTIATRAMEKPGGTNDMGGQEITTVRSGEEIEMNVSIKVEKDIVQKTEKDDFERTKRLVSRGGFKNGRKRMYDVNQIKDPLYVDPIMKKLMEGLNPHQSPPTASRASYLVLPGHVRLATELADTNENGEGGEETVQQEENVNPNIRDGLSLVVAGTETGGLATILGQPRGIPTLLVKFFNLNEEAERLAEILLNFDHDRGDLVGDIQRNGVKVGMYIGILHCVRRDEVYKLRDMLKGIEGTFCGSTIISEIN